MTRGPATAHSNLFNHGDHRRGRLGASRGRQLGPSTPQLTEVASWDATEIGERQSCALTLFPGDISDYELTDHATTRRRLSELQRIDPMILVLSRGHFCPNDHQQHLELAATTRRSRSPPRRSSQSPPTTSSKSTGSGLWSARSGRFFRRGPKGPKGSADPGVHRPVPRPDELTEALLRVLNSELRVQTAPDATGHGRCFT
jgi:hypothetical protein